jgi:Mor family transcriptional regulator
MLKKTPEPTEHRTPGQREDDAWLLKAEFTEDLRTHAGLCEQEAARLAALLVQSLRLRHGARRIYIPGVDKSERDAAIRQRFNGLNAAACCREFNISRSRLYEIAGQSRAG